LLFHRLPTPGESCFLEVRGVEHDERMAKFDFCVWNQGGEILLEARGYQTAWLESQALPR
jgi:hypothetical protein